MEMDEANERKWKLSSKKSSKNTHRTKTETPAKETDTNKAVRTGTVAVSWIFQYSTFLWTWIIMRLHLKKKWKKKLSQLKKEKGKKTAAASHLKMPKNNFEYKIICKLKTWWESRKWEEWKPSNNFESLLLYFSNFSFR